MKNDETSTRQRGGDPGGVAASARDWRDRLDDPDEPLLTVAIAADLLGIDTQTLRRLAASVDHDGRRPSGNQRRYSRNDLEMLSRARELSTDGHNGASIARIMDLEQQVGDLPSGGGSSTEPRAG